MALGAFTIVKKYAAQGPVFHVLATQVGDGAYATGGSSGLLAALRTALGDDNIDIIDCRDAYQAITTRATHVVYDAVNDKLISRTTSTGAEFTTADQSSTTHTLMITAA